MHDITNGLHVSHGTLKKRSDRAVCSLVIVITCNYKWPLSFPLVWPLPVYYHFLYVHGFGKLWGALMNYKGKSQCKSYQRFFAKGDKYWKEDHFGVRILVLP